VSRKTLLILGVVVLAVLGVIAWLTLSGSNTATGGDASAQGYEILPTDRTLGNPKAKAVLIEYAAPSCPVCAAFNAQSFGRLKTQYIDTGKVFYVFRVFPLRPDDGAAEKLARCLPEDKYFDFIDLLFRNQPQWDVEYGVTDVHGGLVRLGRIAGMSAAQVDQCIANKAEDERINKVAADGEAKYNITGTPTFILNGVSQGSGNIPFETISKLLDKALAGEK
jgi:protein-disulfide isomerase